MKTFYKFIINAALLIVGFIAFLYIVGEPTEDNTMSWFMILFTKAIAGFIIYICFQLWLFVSPEVRAKIEDEEI